MVPLVFGADGPMRKSTPLCSRFWRLAFQCCYRLTESVSFPLQFCHDSSCIQVALLCFTARLKIVRRLRHLKRTDRTSSHERPDFAFVPKSWLTSKLEMSGVLAATFLVLQIRTWRLLLAVGTDLVSNGCFPGACLKKSEYTPWNSAVGSNRVTGSRL
jgi:hypothetical protein